MSNEYKSVERLTSPQLRTESLGKSAAVATLDDPPPGYEKALDPAATGSRADYDAGATFDTNTTNRPATAIDSLAPADDTPRMRYLRGKLAVARDLASREIGRWSAHGDAAHQLYGLIAQAACQFIYAPVSVDRLEIAVTYCRRLLLSASQIDCLELEAA